jgi:MFS family permease
MFATSSREDLYQLPHKSKSFGYTWKWSILIQKQWAFLSFFFIFELGSLLCGLSTSSKMLIVARAVAGLGSAGLMNGSLTIISSSVPLHKSPRMLLDTMCLIIS